MSGYIEFQITNVEPLRIADIYTSKDNQIDTLKYIPGSSIRGMVINRLARKLNNFEELKKQLLTDVCFLNAYPVQNGINLMPSPKGFYEDKRDTKELVNVFKSELEGKKRAGLGAFCYLNGTTIEYYTPETGETLNINTNDDNMYRMQYLKKNQVFRGYIKLNDNSEKLTDCIIEVLKSGNIKLGSDKSSGLGACTIDDIKTSNEIPFSQYGVKQTDELKSVYMLILSNTTMLDCNGENCGIDISYLKRVLNNNSLNIKDCSTSVIDVSGVNRTWGIRTPSYKMYQSGSVFKVESDDFLNTDMLKKIEDTGIGIRRAEGCGRVLFTNALDGISHKAEIINNTYTSAQTQSADKLDNIETGVLKLVAKSIYMNRANQQIERYVVDNENEIMRCKKGASDSQIGLILTECQNNSYTPEKAIQKIEELFSHIENDKKTVISAKYKGMIEFVRGKLYCDLTVLLGLNSSICGYMISNDKDLIKYNLLSNEEITVLKLKVIESTIKFYIRGKDNGK